MGAESPVNTEALETLHNPPKTIDDLQNLLGFLGYYRQSICHISPKLICCSKTSQGQQSSNEKIEFTKDLSKLVQKFIKELKFPKTMAYPDFLLLFSVNFVIRNFYFYATIL